MLSKTVTVLKQLFVTYWRFLKNVHSTNSFCNPKQLYMFRMK